VTTLTKRVLTAVVLAAVAGAALFAVPEPGGILFFSALLLIGLWEWSGFLQPPRLGARVTLCVLALLLGALSATDAALAQSVLAAAVAWWLGLGVWLTRDKKVIGSALVVVSAWVCLVPAWLSLRILLEPEAGGWLFIWLVAIVAAADIGAYFTGRALGRHKLAPRLSPGKTVEGLVGGLVSAAAVCAGGAWLQQQSPWAFAAVGALVGGVSVIGDLTVSAFKRHAGLKDTGRLLPGHGGVMDRVDSLVAAAPVFVLVLSTAGLLP